MITSREIQQNIWVTFKYCEGDFLFSTVD